MRHAVHAGRDIVQLVALVGVRRQGQDRQGAGRAGQGADSPRRSDAVHHRHLDVHQGQVERTGHHGIHRLAPVLGHLAGAAEHLQQLARDEAVGGVVVHHQHMQGVVRRRLGHGGGGRRALGRDAQRQAHLKARAALGRGAQRDRAAHPFGDLSADGQAQARARPLASGLSGVERIKDGRGRRLGHARAAVVHGEDDLAVGTAFDQGHDLARQGELQGVADQVVQQLLQPHPVGLNARNGQVGADGQGQGLFVGPRAPQGVDVEGDGRQVQRLLLQRQHAGRGA